MMWLDWHILIWDIEALKDLKVSVLLQGTVKTINAYPVVNMVLSFLYLDKTQN